MHYIIFLFEIICILYMVFIGIMYTMVLQDYRVTPSLKPFSRRSLKYCKYRAKWQKVGPGGGGLPYNIYIYINDYIHIYNYIHVRNHTYVQLCCLKPKTILQTSFLSRSQDLLLVSELIKCPAVPNCNYRRLSQEQSRLFEVPPLTYMCQDLNSLSCLSSSPPFTKKNPQQN